MSINLAAVPINFGNEVATYRIVNHRQKPDLLSHVAGKAHYIKTPPEDRGYWVKDPTQEERHIAIEFLTYGFKDKNKAIQKGHAWFLLIQNSQDPKDLLWYTRAANRIAKENHLGLGHYRENDSKFSKGQHITLPPLEIAMTPQIETSESELIGATTTTPANHTDKANGHSNRALSGVPPPMFNGDRDKSETFMDKFTSYELVNGDSKQFTTPFLKVALCLSYFNGPKVDTWVRQKRSWLKEQRDLFGVSIANPQLWTDFERTYKDAFTDQDAKLAAYQELHSLKMQGSDIDSYIAKFDRLISKVGHNPTDIGVVMMFREGLQPLLLREVLLHNVPTPTTLGVWKRKARERQMVYKELRNASLHRSNNGGPTDLQKKWANRLGLKHYQTPAQRATNPTPRYTPPRMTNSQVVPMDVDTGAMGNPPPYRG